ncbi:MAG: hypothetical protein HY754_09250 [Nitrospirae bacterium]|nr:hypothetical protein [Nitrospirota bacterium]
MSVKMILLVFTAIALIASVSFAADDVEKGKKLFKDPKFGGGTAGKSCNSCHPNGRGLEKSADKKEFTLMGKTVKTLEEVVNICIETPMKGKAIDVKSEQMKNIVAYIKSLKTKK